MLIIMISQHRLISTVFFFGFVAFMLMGMFGMSHLGMDMDADGHMSDCPFMLSASLCTMTPFEHIAAFKHLLNATAQHKLTSSLLKLFSIITALSFFLRRSLLYITPLRTNSPYACPLYPLQPRHILQEAFSDGILNSKRF